MKQHFTDERTGIGYTLQGDLHLSAAFSFQNSIYHS